MNAAESKEINELRTGELVKVNGDWYVFGIAEVNGEIDEETGAVEVICHPALYTTTDWFAECEAELAIKAEQELDKHISAAFEHYTTPDQIVSTGKFLKGYKPTN